MPVKVNVDMSTTAESEILCVENKTDTENTVLYDVRLSVDECEKEKTEKRNVTFKDEVNEYIDVSPDVKLDDTLSVNDLFIDESVGSEALGSDIKGGDIPLEDQEEFQSTPPCSQIPQVDPYVKQRCSYRYLILHILQFTYNNFGNTFDNLNSFMLQIIDVQRCIKFAFTVLQKKTMVVMSLMMSKA